MRSRFHVALMVLAVAFAAAGAALAEAPAEPAVEAGCPAVVDAGEPSPPPAPECANDQFTGYDGLLVLAPHPDDETLGFGGLIHEYLARGKPVEVVVVTDGDAYCEACQFWKSGTLAGPVCDALELSNLATEEVDSFAEVRRGESLAAMAILGAGEPAFLGYPDTGLAAAWRNAESGEASKALTRSDFSACDDCESCGDGYGGGPATALSAETLTAALKARLDAVPAGTLVATTHWLDSHGDHAALGSFVKRLNGELEVPRATAYAVIHAHTSKDAAYADCWYPGPEAPVCPCFLESCFEAEPDWLEGHRLRRLRPDWPGALPDDADYGEASHLCLAEDMWSGPATKLQAVRAYPSQLGHLARGGGRAPAPLSGLVDCNGYLLSFVRSTEAFVLIDVRKPPMSQ